MADPMKGPVDTGPPDSIATNRRLPVVPRSDIPAVPVEYQLTPVDVRRKELRVLGGSLNAEAKDALRELAGNAATYKADLGDLAPDLAPASVLLTRLNDVGASLVRARALVHYLEELEDIAVSDAVLLIEGAHKEFAHRVERLPQIAERYRALSGFIDARNSAISEGIARAKAAKKEPEPA